MVRPSSDFFNTISLIPVIQHGLGDALNRLRTSALFGMLNASQRHLEESRMKTALLTALSLLSVASPMLAQSGDFNLTYHVERTPTARLSLATCGNAVAQVARRSGLSADVQSFPGKLVIVKGGRAGSGAFVVQCIAVNNTTVSVVQGIDYRTRKAALGQFADRAFVAVKAAIK